MLGKMKKNTPSIMKAVFSAFVVAALLFSSCTKSELEDLQLTNPEKVSGTNTNTTTDLGNQPPNIPFDPMIGISHGSCMGNCPVYTISLSRDGDVVYNGIDNVAVRGVVRYKISAEEAYQLGYMMEDGGFFNFASEYIVI